MIVNTFSGSKHVPEQKRPKRKRPNLILSVAEPQRGVDEGEEDREDHSGEKDQDAAKLEEQKILTFERRNCGTGQFGHTYTI